MKKRIVKVGYVEIGHPRQIIVQSMTNTKTEQVKETVSQIIKLKEAGCDLVRVTVSNSESVQAIREIKKQVDMPLIADLHYDTSVIFDTIVTGVEKIRINPGTLKDEETFLEVVRRCKANNVTMRIGVNAGSLHKEYEKKYADDVVMAMFKSIERYVYLAETLDYTNMVLSAKSSNVLETIGINQKLDGAFDYPIHIGVTEAGTLLKGAVRNAVGISALLSQGIGNTIRVSLTADPIEEVKVAHYILSDLGYEKPKYDIISCPTCGRTDIALQPLVNALEEKIEATPQLFEGLKIAVMGCVVNGPGEAKSSDYGITGGKGKGIIFRKGIVIKTVAEKDLLSELISLIQRDKEDCI